MPCTSHVRAARTRARSVPPTPPFQRLTRGHVPTALLPFSAGDAGTQVEDDDVADERVRVNTRQFPITSSLVMHSMRKAFGPTKVAVKGVSLAVDSDTIFGLLGPNGAGKTTLINILTGLYEATDGDATIDGYRLGTQMRDVYMSIGVCPQHDILWGDLTVEDHLLFYARLKGVGPAREKTVVDAMLANMSLERFRTRQTKGLSGGEKRRVSIAIALIGESKVVFLDEPTVRSERSARARARWWTHRPLKRWRSARHDRRTWARGRPHRQAWTPRSAASSGRL